MPYGTIKVDTITFTAGGVDTSVSISGLVQNPTFTGNITSTGTISGNIIQGGTTVSGATVTGTTANFVSGVFTTQISGTTIRTTTGVFASGTAAAPSITFNGDLDTGLFTGAANTVGIAANGAAVLTVSGTNVGIGTGSPGELLHVNGNALVKDRLLLQRLQASDNLSVLTFSDTLSGSKGNNLSLGNPGGFDLLFHTGGVEKARIDSSGRLGIGTNSPNAILDLTATAGAGGQTSVIRFGLGITAESWIGVANGTGNIIANSALGDTVIRNDGGKILLSTDSGTTAHAVIDSSGRLGIGTTSPGAKLQVNQNTDTATAISVVSASANTTITTDFASLFLQNTNTTNNNYNSIGFINDQGSYSASIHGIYTSHTAGAQSGVLAFATREAGTYGEKMRITAGGSVGIGTTGPGIISGMSKYLTLSATNSGEAPSFEIVGNRNTSPAATIGRISFINTAIGNNEVARINCETGSAGGGLAEADLGFYTSGTRRLQITANGTLWIGGDFAKTNAASAQEIQFHNYLTLGQAITGAAPGFLAWNATSTATPGVYKARATGDRACVLELTSSGNLVFSNTGSTSQTAGSNLSSYTERFRIAADGTVTVAGKFEVGATPVGFNGGSISSPARGNIYYDTDGSGWQLRIGKLQSGTFTPQMTLQDNGTVAIGTTSSVGKLTVATSSADPFTGLSAWSDGYFVVTPGGTTTSSGIGLSFNTSTNTGGISCATPGSAWRELIYVASAHRFALGASEAARIDNSGRLLVGTSSTTGANVKGVFGAGLGSTDGVLVINTNDQAIYGIAISNWDGATTTNGAKMSFSNSGIGEFIIGAGSGTDRFEVFNGAGTGVYLTSGNTSWTATSDERLKTDLVPIENAIDRVNLLRAVTGRFKTDEEGVSRGFLIAQDVQSVFPEAVDNSNPDELGVRYTEVIPLLVAALKESKERIEALEAKVAALKSA